MAGHSEETEKSTFYVCKPLIKEYNNSILMAKIISSKDFRRDFKDDWNFPPLSEYSTGTSKEFFFSFNSKHPLPDNLFTGSKFDLYSDDLINLVRIFGVEFELFTATLTDFKRDVVNSESYKVFHLLGEFPAIDWERTIHDKFSYFDSLILNEETMMRAPALFVNSNKNNLVLIREDLKSAIEHKGLTGFSFYTLSEYAQATRRLSP